MVTSINLEQIEKCMTNFKGVSDGGGRMSGVKPCMRGVFVNGKSLFSRIKQIEERNKNLTINKIFEICIVFIFCRQKFTKISLIILSVTLSDFEGHC